MEPLEDSPVTLIHGLHQCGETTLTQMAYFTFQFPEQIAVSSSDQARAPSSLSTPSTEYWYVTYDDGVAREATLSDSNGIVADLSGRANLDEAQRVPLRILWEKF